MAWYDVARSLRYLCYLEELKDWSALIKDLIQILKIELKFLRLFFMCIRVKKIEDPGLVDRVSKLKAVMQDLAEVVHSCFVKAKDDDDYDDEKVSMHVDGSLTDMLERIESIKPEVNQCYSRISRLANDGDIERNFWLKVIDSVLENLKDLKTQSSQVTSILKVKKIIDTLERKLLLFRNSFQFIFKLGVSGWDLCEEIGYAAVTAASFFFHCWISKMDDENNELPDLSLALHFMPDHEETSLYSIMLLPSTLRDNSEETLVVGFTNFLLQHLGEVLSSDSSLEIVTKDQLESLHEELKLLRFLHTGNRLQHADHGISYKQRMGNHVNKAGRTIEDLYVGNIKEEKMTKINNDILPQVLARLKFINIFCGIELLNREASSVAPIKDQIEILYKDMRFLRDFFFHTQKGDNIEKEFMDIHSNMDLVFLEAAPVLYSLYIGEIKQDMADEMIRLLPDLIEKINPIMVDIWRISLPLRSLYFPKISSQRATSSSLEQLTKLLAKRADTVSLFVKPHMRKYSILQIEYVKNKLELLVSFLVKFEEQCIEIEESIALEIRIMNMANDAEHVTDPIFIRDNPDVVCLLTLSALAYEVNLINKEMEIINEKLSGEMLSLQDNALSEVVVGFDDAGQEIIEKLVNGPEKLNVISIIGMGGLGKTTLAKKLYNNSEVVEYFDVRAFCCISQLFQKRQVLLDILGQIVEITGRINQNTTEEDLENMLYKSLSGRRYLIVMDDMWDVEAWYSLRRCFHDDSMGSRILFTTRLKEVASNVKVRGSIAHQLRFFNDDESFELLQKKLYPRGKCPKGDFEYVKQIAKNCKGLPIAVVLMAGVLGRKRRDEWNEVAESLSRHTNGDVQNLSMEVMEFSYKNLPDSLRPCFLYLGGFPEDKEIPVKKLKWLWVAEGFAQKNEQRSPEDIAEEYLMDLIGRSLLTIAEKGYGGRVKTCRIHDLLLEFSWTKAKKDKFSILLDGKDEPSLQPSDDIHKQVDGHEKYRLCVYSMLKDFNEWPSSFDVCSLLHFSPIVPLSLMSSYVSFIIRSFKFLNVLDLERLLLKDLNWGVELLVQLRLLSVRIQSNSIPSSISNLTELETLIVKGRRGEVAAPDTIWSMESLKHLHIDNRAFLVRDKRDVKDVASHKLETISTPCVSCRDNSRDLICSLLNLLKLKCIFSDVDSGGKFPNLETLVHLESLKVLYYGRKVSNGIFIFPSNLKKLTLSKFQLPWSDITTIGTLPNLEVLKLLFRAFDGEVWETRDDEFPKLKYLKLESLDVEQWNVASEDHFPRLEKLVMHRCKKLQEIPPCFADMNTLLMIEVKWCNLSAASSAQRIYDEQKDMGNESFIVNIHPNPSDQGLASSS